MKVSVHQRVLTVMIKITIALLLSLVMQGLSVEEKGRNSPSYSLWTTLLCEEIGNPSCTERLDKTKENFGSSGYFITPEKMRIERSSSRQEKSQHREDYRAHQNGGSSRKGRDTDPKLAQGIALWHMLEGTLANKSQKLPHQVQNNYRQSVTKTERDSEGVSSDKRYGRFISHNGWTNASNNDNKGHELENEYVEVEEEEAKPKNHAYRKGSHEVPRNTRYKVVAKPIPVPVFVKVPQPYPVRVPVPVEKIVHVPVEKIVEHPVEEPVAVRVVKKLPVPYVKPYPVPAAVYKRFQRMKELNEEPEEDER